MEHGWLQRDEVGEDVAFVGLPVLLACLWGTVETLAEFLPNLV
ncbi:hypothetical protein ACFFX1_23680 [Dactylosporangium sucinum]|nr:hypothetical protein [Dactylosporangium sucinum]